MGRYGGVGSPWISRHAGPITPAAGDIEGRVAVGGFGATVSDVSTGSQSQRVESARPAGETVGRLLSVNVGMPKDVSWHGRTVFTGVFKDPVTGRRRVGKLNVEGDGQGDLAGHGGEQRAVFVYQIESYRFWERELGRSDFVCGQFGENFTVEGLADDEVCVGDRYRIGSAIFEVTQPRVTCYRVDIRMNDPRIPALLVSHRRPSFYFRVLEEGEVVASLPNARSYVYYSRPGRDDVKGRDFDGTGHLTGSVLAELEPPSGAQAYLCGPAPFMDEISAGLASFGIEASHLHTEPFGPAASETPGIAATPTRPPHPPVGEAGNGPTIQFARSDLAIPWRDVCASLLELAEACDVPVRWSCRTGVCQTCETSIIAGSVGYNPDPVEAPPDGSVLPRSGQGMSIGQRGLASPLAVGAHLRTVTAHSHLAPHR